MPFAIELSAESERDFKPIDDHLVDSHVGVGEARRKTARRPRNGCRESDGRPSRW